MSAASGAPEARRARIEALATLPLFHKLRGRRALVAGAGQGAIWKVELLVAAGALVDVVAPAPSEEARDFVAALAPAATLHARRWTEADFADRALAIGDCADDDEAAAFARAARAAGALVNVVDKPAFCDVQFGSIVNRSPLVVGISTDGAAPVFGQALRTAVETLLPHGFKDWARAARDWRGAVAKLGLDFRGRRNVWERFAAMALARPERGPDAAERDAFLAAAGQDAAAPARGRVALVGAGPGDPELVTLKAARLLRSADVVLYDDLVDPRVVEMARREAERIHVGKRGRMPSVAQAAISGLLVELARAGKRVVRLKGGDPLVFGRAGEEIAALAKAGYGVEIVPGITAASGAAAALRVSLTHRDHARRLQFVTAHDRGGELPTDLDWRALVDPAATTVVYMGVRTLPALVGRLLAEGVAPDTPAAFVERATQTGERILRASLSELPALVAAAAPEGPCLTLYGRAIGEADVAAALSLSSMNEG
ncbi:MAG: uroporphyrinogen-III C-methyltransferase [Hyphomicrobiales bacterium]|nr:siroheme synthase CysG [Hyphomicrobiales bacterium]MDE2016980.1 uroporphyrinogen-III C-methyltransferase [Hyphomicrobiales bacterium]